MAELSESGMVRQSMSWSNMFKNGNGRQVVSKVDAARQEGYDAGYRQGWAAAELSTPNPLHRDLEADRRAELRGYVKALASTVLAIESMPPKTGRKQILAAVEEQLMAKREQMKEDRAQEVRGD